MKKVVVGIISRKRNGLREEYLLVQSRKDFGEFSGFYYPPGGHVEEGESASDALIREIEEELGLQVTPNCEVVSTPSDIAGQITHWWLCEVKDGEIRMAKDELSDAGYFTAQEMEKMNIWPASRNFFKTHIFKTSS